MQACFRPKALDGRDLPVLELGRQQQAGQSAFAVHQDGAGAALAGPAAFLGTGEPQVLTQEVHDPAVRRRLQPNSVPVQNKLDRHHPHSLTNPDESANGVGLVRAADECLSPLGSPPYCPGPIRLADLTLQGLPNSFRRKLAQLKKEGLHLQSAPVGHGSSNGLVVPLHRRLFMMIWFIYSHETIEATLGNRSNGDHMNRLFWPKLVTRTFFSDLVAEI
jgi:hypothetical protein